MLAFRPPDRHRQAGCAPHSSKDGPHCPFHTLLKAGCPDECRRAGLAFGGGVAAWLGGARTARGRGSLARPGCLRGPGARFPLGEPPGEVGDVGQAVGAQQRRRRAGSPAGRAVHHDGFVGGDGVHAAPQVGQRDFDRIWDGAVARSSLSRTSMTVTAPSASNASNSRGEVRWCFAPDRSAWLGTRRRRQRVDAGHVAESRLGQAGCRGVFLAGVDDHHDGVIVITDRGGVGRHRAGGADVQRVAQMCRCEVVGAARIQDDRAGVDRVPQFRGGQGGAATRTALGRAGVLVRLSMWASAMSSAVAIGATS